MACRALSCRQCGYYRSNTAYCPHNLPYRIDHAAMIAQASCPFHIDNAAMIAQASRESFRNSCISLPASIRMHATDNTTYRSGFSCLSLAQKEPACEVAKDNAPSFGCFFALCLWLESNGTIDSTENIARYQPARTIQFLA